jgi:hypothetical protein
LDVVGRGTIEGALAAMLDLGAGIADEAIGCFDALDGAERLRYARQSKAVQPGLP